MGEEKVGPERVVEKRAHVGEGSVWDPEEKLLYWVDILSHQLYIYDPDEAADRRSALDLGLDRGILQDLHDVLVRAKNPFLGPYKTMH